MAPKGKPGTKGQKQIVEENKSTLRFYQYVILAVNIVYFLAQYLLFWESYTLLPIMLSILAVLICFGSYQFMTSMGRPTYGAGGTLLDGGIDLNMDSGMSEHAKDMILLTCIVQFLSLISNYAWLFLLTAPARAFYVLWVNILGPWFFAPAPEVDEKKQRKMEKKKRF